MNIRISLLVLALLSALLSGCEKEEISSNSSSNASSDLPVFKANFNVNFDYKNLTTNGESVIFYTTLCYGNVAIDNNDLSLALDSGTGMAWNYSGSINTTYNPAAGKPQLVIRVVANGGGNHSEVYLNVTYGSKKYSSQAVLGAYSDKYFYYSP